MRSIIACCSFFLFGCLQLQAQKPGEDYIFSSDYFPITPYNTFTGKPDNPDSAIYQARLGQIFTIKRAIIPIGGQAGYYVVFWPFKTNGAQRQPLVKGPTPHHYIDGSTANGKVFFITAADLTSQATPFIKQGTLAKIDAVVLPIKIRFRNHQLNGDFSFEQSISLGPAVSFTRRLGGLLSTDTWSILGGLNVTNVSVDSTTAPRAVLTKTTELGLTPFLGASLSYKGVNFALLTGFDILTGKAGQTWVYRKSPWLGLSVGVSIIQAKVSSNSTSNQAKSPDESK